MMGEVSNRFHSALAGTSTAANHSTSFVVPAGCYFKGQLAWSWVAGGATTSVQISKGGVNSAIIAPIANLTVGQITGLNIPLILDEGTYTVASIQAGTSSTIAWSGICYRK